MQQFGTINIKINELLKEKKLSKKQVKKRAHLQSTQFNRYCKNEVERIDKDVLARMCAAFECEVSDILEYIPPQTKDLV